MQGFDGRREGRSGQREPPEQLEIILSRERKEDRVFPGNHGVRPGVFQPAEERFAQAGAGAKIAGGVLGGVGDGVAVPCCSATINVPLPALDVNNPTYTTGPALSRSLLSLLPPPLS